MDPDAWRQRFPVLSRCIYLNNNALGAMPGTVPARLSDYASLWETEGSGAWAGWFPVWMKACELFGRLIGAAPEEVCLVSNVSAATASVLSALDFTGKRRTIVTTTGEFPSNLYLYTAWEKYGARVVTVDPDELPGAIDDETALVAVSHVHSFTGRKVDPRPISAAAHRRGALVYIDAYQSLGVVPVDVQEMGADLLAGGVVKWCCGGPGAAFLYVAPRVQNMLEPAIRGWLGHERPFAFLPSMCFADGAARFTLGTPSVPSIYTAVAGLEVILEAGVAAIRRRNETLTERVVAVADQLGIPVVSPRRTWDRGGHVTLNPQHAGQVAHHLHQANIRVDYREGAGIRVAPHFFNTEEEVDAAVTEMGRLHQSALP